MIVALQLILTALYVGYIWKRFGKLESISESTYHLTGADRAWFLGWLGSIGLLNLVHPMGMYGVLTMAFLWFTGVTINHESKKAFTKHVHMIGAVGAILISLAGLFFLHGLWIPTAIVATAIPIIKWLDRKHFIWWIEIVAIITILISYTQI